MALMHVAPSVSVVIPTHNSAAFIPDAVWGVLAQTFDDVEIIVVDDGSTDDTADLVRAFDGVVRYYHQRNQGVAAARNAGIDMAAGEFVCFLDADDQWMPEKLARQIDVMKQHPELGMLFADATESRGDHVQKSSILATMAFGADVRSQMPLEDAFRKLLIENFVPTSTVMIRKSCFDTTGVFDVALPNAEDREMWLRLAAHFPIGCLPQVLARKRSHEANISARTELALRSRIRVWQRCRERFPVLAPASVYDQQLAVTYQELGYLALANENAREARRCAIASLTCAIRAVSRTRSFFHFRWMLSIALVPLSFMRWRVVQMLWHTRNALLRRTTTPAAAR